MAGKMSKHLSRSFVDYNDMDKYALIVAGGVGNRAGGELPKQFHSLKGHPMLWWAMKAFKEAEADSHIIIVMHPDYIEIWKEIFNSLPCSELIPHALCQGGKTRAESVANGLKKIKEIGADGDSVIMIHDAARPLVTPEIIKRGLASLKKGRGAIPVIRSVNSLRILDNKNMSLYEATSRSVDRALYVEVQTPQIFHLSTISPLYEEASDLTLFTDDASVAEGAGVPIDLFEGDAINLKVTHPTDFKIAEAILA